jgi:hypothetical protein
MELDGTGAATPDVEEVRRIAAIGDPVLRNLEITYCYSRLAAAVARRTGGGANWCTFATWASRQAGSTIRGEDAETLLRTRLRLGPDLMKPITSLWRSLLRRGLMNPGSRLARLTAEIHTPFDAVERAGDAVACGNKKVFEEIGLEFARFLHACPADAPADGPEIRAFVGGLRPGDPPDGQEYLRAAFCTISASTASATPAPAPSFCSSPTSRSECTSRRGCSPRSATRSTLRTSPTRT